MSKQEMRFIRREIINRFLKEWGYWNNYKSTRDWIRFCELVNYGSELKAYA